MKLDSISPPLRWTLIRRGGIFLAVILGIVLLVDNWLPYALLSHHNRSVDSQLRPTEEEISITAADGTVTQGWLIPAEQGSQAEQDASVSILGNPTTLILLHGLGANRQDYLDFGLELQQRAAERGIPLAIAAMDLRSHGESGGDYFTYGYQEVQDITALVDELEVQNVSSEIQGSMRYVILGISVGGAVATAAVANDDRITALITIGTFADLAATAETQTKLLPHFWRDRILRRAEAIAQFDITEAATAFNMAQVQVPVLIAHGSQDGYIPFSNAEQLYAVAHEPKQLYPIAGADHADMISTGGEALQGEILQFLQGAIATPASEGIVP